jgi:hypothetical protein
VRESFTHQTARRKFQVQVAEMRARKIFCAYPMQKIALVILIPTLSVADQRGRKVASISNQLLPTSWVLSVCEEYSVHSGL